MPPTSGGAADLEAVRRFTLASFQGKAARVRQLAERAGRDPASLVLSAMFFVQLAESDGEARELTGTVASRYGLSVADAERFPLTLIGTPAQLRERLAERIARLDLGYVVLQFSSPTTLARFGAEVLPAVRGG